GTFWIRFPDPGTASALRAFRDSLDNVPGVRSVSFILQSTPNMVVEGRYPSDGPGYGRSDWTGTSTSTWAFRAIRAPLAWGCETGTYGAPPVRTGVLEWKHDHGHPEFQA